MKDIYKNDLEDRIHDFLDRKTRKYPELRLFDGVGQESIRPDKSQGLHRHPPRTIIVDSL